MLVLDLTGSVKVDFIGVLWGMAAAVCLVIYFFITAKENDTLPPLVLASGGLVVGAVVMWLVGAVGLLPMTFSTANTSLGPWETPWWVSVGGLVILATVLAYVSGIMAARSLGSKLASFVSLTEVLFAVLWAWLLLGELPGSIQLLGGLLIVGGVVLVRVDELRGDKRAARVDPVAERVLDHANDVEPVLVLNRRRPGRCGVRAFPNCLSWKPAAAARRSSERVRRRREVRRQPS